MLVTFRMLLGLKARVFFTRAVFPRVLLMSGRNVQACTTVQGEVNLSIERLHPAVHDVMATARPKSTMACVWIAAKLQWPKLPMVCPTKPPKEGAAPLDVK